MNIGARFLLLLAAIICFLISIFVNKHAIDWLAIGFICFAGSFIVSDLGWDRGVSRRT